MKRIQPSQKRPRGVPRRRLRLERLEDRCFLSSAALNAPIGTDAAASTAASSTVITQLDPLPIKSSTAENPQSKVWTHDGYWWSALPDDSGTWIWRLDGTQWNRVLKLTTTKSRVDVKPAGDLAHILLYKSTSTQLASVEYVPGSPGQYQFWQVRPQLVAVPLSGGSSSATLDIDSTGRMWEASDTFSTIEVRYSDFPYSNWSSPIVVAPQTGSNEISAITALPNGTMAVMWSNQSTQRFGFRVHVDGTSPTQWSADEVPASQSALPIGGGMADDHIHLAVASDGTLYAAVKTAYDDANFPLMALLVRRPPASPFQAGTWDDLYSVDTAGTRPLVILDESQSSLLFVYSGGTGISDIVYKESPVSSINLTGPRRILIAGGDLKDPTSTRQNIQGDVVILATTTSSMAAGVRMSVSGAPFVDAGPDQQVFLSDTASLNGTVTDDGLPDPPGAVTITWLQLSGPGSVVFADASSATTTATFSAAGTYVLGLRASDGQSVSFDDCTITVLEQSSPIVQSFQDGTLPDPLYSGTRDSYISSDSPAKNFGNASVLKADGSPDMAAMLKWDLGGIPPGSSVTSATITLNVTVASSSPYTIYALKRDWLEGQATWQSFRLGSAWQIAGAQGAADRDSVVLGVFVAPGVGLVSINLNADGIAAVQSWIDNPSLNFGIILQDYANTSHRLVFSSRNDPTAGNRPKLTVNYTSASGNQLASTSTGEERLPSLLSAVEQENDVPNANRRLESLAASETRPPDPTQSLIRGAATTTGEVLVETPGNAFNVIRNPRHSTSELANGIDQDELNNLEPAITAHQLPPDMRHIAC